MYSGLVEEEGKREKMERDASRERRGDGKGEIHGRGDRRGEIHGKGDGRDEIHGRDCIKGKRRDKWWT